jgi:predicted ATPase
MLANRINRLTVRNYRSLADVTVDFEDLTVLVGPNGGGKSNILDVLRFVRDALMLGLDKAMQDRGGITSLRRFSPDGELYDIEISLQITLNNQSFQFGLILGSHKNDEYYIKEDSFDAPKEYQAKDSASESSVDNDKKAQSVKHHILSLLGHDIRDNPLYTYLAGLAFYSIFPNSLREPQKIGKPYPLEEDGGNLATLLRDFIANPNNTWREDLYQSLAIIIPHVIPDNPLSVESLGSFIIVKLKHTNGAEFDLFQESDGTLRVLALLTALYQQPPLPLIGIEEPELTIYPRALESLCEIIDETSCRSQIILTTHSPELINYFKADSLRAVGIVDGATQIGRIREDQRQVIVEQLYKGGDLLMMEGLKLG